MRNLSSLSLGWMMDLAWLLLVSFLPPAPGLVQQYHTNFVNWNRMLKRGVLINTIGIEPKRVLRTKEKYMMLFLLFDRNLIWLGPSGIEILMVLLLIMFLDVGLTMISSILRSSAAVCWLGVLLWTAILSCKNNSSELYCLDNRIYWPIFSGTGWKKSWMVQLLCHLWQQ